MRDGLTPLNQGLQVVTPQLLEELRSEARQRLRRTKRRLSPAEAASHFGRMVRCPACRWSGRVRLLHGSRLRDFGCPECGGRLRVVHAFGCTCANCRRADRRIDPGVYGFPLEPEDRE